MVFRSFYSRLEFLLCHCYILNELVLFFSVVYKVIKVGSVQKIQSYD